MEGKIGYDLFSNIPGSIQDAIENQSITDIEAKLNQIDNPSSPLLAVTNEDLYLHGTTMPISPLGSFNNSSIWHSSIQNQIVKTINIATSDVSPLEIGIVENSFFKTHIDHVSSTEYSQGSVNVSHNTSSQIGINERASDQTSTTKISITNDSIGNNAFVHENSSQVSTSKIDSDHTNLPEISSPQINVPQNDSFEVNSRVMSGRTVGVDQLDSSEVTFPIVVSDQQFFRSDFPSHETTPQIINKLNNSATKIWSDLLQSETQLDIDFQITDLPTGQLAEASITGFDDSGVPNAGTILIDHDANGVGWFIDETPLDNSEFVVQDTDSYLLATAESEANGKYDLLTTVLHELAHLYGFMEGYSGFDTLVSGEREKVKGQREETDTFTPYPLTFNQGEAIFDGEHLDRQAHPYDLLNTHLAPGTRKLPSELDVEILQALIATEFEKNGSKPAGDELLAKLTSDPLLAIDRQL